MNSRSLFSRVISLLLVAGIASAHKLPLETLSEENFIYYGDLTNYLNEERPLKSKFASSSSVCFDDLGCFDREPLGVLPSDPNVVQAKFHMSDGISTADFTWNEKDLSKASPLMKPNTKLVILTHGFAESMSKDYMIELKDALVKNKDNDTVVMTMDWGRGSLLPFYTRSVGNVPLVARVALNMVTRLGEQFPGQIVSKDITFIGFSLGAQVAGYFARGYRNSTGEIIGKLVALDAAAPNFELYNIFPKREDADLVIGYHTSAGDSIVTGKVGVRQPFGHISYFFNGGISQPKCGFLNLVCSHQRAFRYFTAMLNNGGDLYKCAEWVKCCDSVEEANNHACTKECSPEEIVANEPTIVYVKTVESNDVFCVSQS